MKRYMVFVYSKYYPSGGMDDFVTSFDEKEAAIEFCGSNPEYLDAFTQLDVWDKVENKYAYRVGFKS